MTINNIKWPPCYVDPRRGIAFFDGITIEADSMNDSRWDRVIPVFEEEQVLVCRQMLPKLKSGYLVLDVGTGSGVYAIWAAKHNCKVIAIDINNRAINKALFNAKNNNIGICQNLENLQEGTIYFAQKEFNDAFKEEYKNHFDIVILSPPYTPSLIRGVAYHAASGEDGQEAFNKQIKIVPDILKEDGCCIGNQMTTVIAKEIKALSKIKQEFNNKCKIRYARIIESDYSTEDFLIRQYANLLNDNNDLKKKIKEVSNGNSSFALIYYEITKNNSNELTIERFKTYTVPNNRNFKNMWDYRIWAHRHCVDYSVERNFSGIFSFFLDDFSLNISDSSTLDIECLKTWKSSDRWKKELWEKSTLRKIDNYIKWKKTWSDYYPSFDLILVDTSPIHYPLEGRKKLSNEVKIWLEEKNEKLCVDLLQEYQLIVASIQEAKLSIFLHPNFTRVLSPQKEWELTFPKSLILPIDMANEKEDLNIYQDCLNNGRLKIDLQFTENLDFKNKFTFIPELGFSTIEVGSISLPHPMELYQELKNPKRFSKAKEYEAILGQENDFNLIKALNNPEFRNDKDKYNQLFLMLEHDLECSTLIMHKEINRKFKMIFQTSDTQCETEKSWSSQLLGIPLGLSYDSSFLKEDDFPIAYRGCVWVYGLTSKEWTNEHELFLADISRLAWLLFLEEYSVDSLKRNKGIERKGAHHHIPKIFASGIDKLIKIQKEHDEKNLPNFEIPGEFMIAIGTLYELAEDLELRPRFPGLEEQMKKEGICKSVIEEIFKFAKQLGHERLKGKGKWPKIKHYPKLLVSGVWNQNEFPILESEVIYLSTLILSLLTEAWQHSTEFAFDGNSEFPQVRVIIEENHVTIENDCDNKTQYLSGGSGAWDITKLLEKLSNWQITIPSQDNIKQGKWIRKITKLGV